MLNFLLIFSTIFGLGNSLICHQCEGWRGTKEHSEKENSCWRLNNNCETNVFCVKITEPMAPTASYEPFKSECWHQNNLVIGPGNSTVVENGCYTVFDQTAPPKRWTYCFCNSEDFCNSSRQDPFGTVLPLLSLLLLIFFVSHGF